MCLEENVWIHFTHILHTSLISCYLLYLCTLPYKCCSEIINKSIIQIACVWNHFVYQKYEYTSFVWCDCIQCELNLNFVWYLCDISWVVMCLEMDNYCLRKDITFMTLLCSISSKCYTHVYLFLVYIPVTWYSSFDTSFNTVHWNSVLHRMETIFSMVRSPLVTYISWWHMLIILFFWTSYQAALMVHM